MKTIKEQLEDLYFSGDCENCQENLKEIKKILDAKRGNSVQEEIK